MRGGDIPWMSSGGIPWMSRGGIPWMSGGSIPWMNGDGIPWMSRGECHVQLSLWICGAALTAQPREDFFELEPRA